MLSLLGFSGLANVVIAKQYSINSIYLFTFTKGPQGATKKIAQRKNLQGFTSTPCSYAFGGFALHEHMIALCDDGS